MSTGPSPWTSLLSEQRPCRSELRPRGRSRNAFQQDADLIVFSAAFRRLQNKTQVHPLEARGRVRTRLTHSIEVASVGRSLGTASAVLLSERGALTQAGAEALPQAVYAACLAHDIGNPPFGHAGEDALDAWFRSHPEHLRGLADEERADLCRFEGNAQGLRILTQLENYLHEGGLRLTYATLGAFMKYTAGSASVQKEGPAPLRKPGYFASEARYVRWMREQCGLSGYARHPLAFLTEAADDICYAIIDVEDGHAMGLIPHEEAVQVLRALARAEPDPALSAHAQLQKLRGIAISVLIEQVSTRFAELAPGLCRGEDTAPLLDGIAAGAEVARAKRLTAERVFAAPAVRSLLHTGEQALHDVLDAWVPAILSAHVAGQERVSLPGRPGDMAVPSTKGQALRSLVDHLTAMTDEHALALGASLPDSGH